MDKIKFFITSQILIVIKEFRSKFPEMTSKFLASGEIQTLFNKTYIVIYKQQTKHQYKLCITNKYSYLVR